MSSTGAAYQGGGKTVGKITHTDSRPVTELPLDRVAVGQGVTELLG